MSYADIKIAREALLRMKHPNTITGDDVKFYNDWLQDNGPGKLLQAIDRTEKLIDTWSTKYYFDDYDRQLHRNLAKEVEQALYGQEKP